MTTLFQVEPESVPGLDLPPLTGSEKQCPWAEKVRAKLVSAIHQHLREWRRLLSVWEQKPGFDPEKLEREREAYATACNACEEIEQETYAGWWLDRRGLTARELLNGADPRPEDLK